jgi:triosephosphate isomerase
MASEGREQIITGNWKMYKTSAEALAFIHRLIPLIKDSSLIKDRTGAVYLAVPFTSIEAVVKAVQGSPIVIGAQNIHDIAEGAFTGEISASMAKAAGAEFVILGHSERRQFFDETDAFINRKVKIALKNELRPMICVGETIEQRQQQLTEKILIEQLSQCLQDLSSTQVSACILAYEPVWAIGTGMTATPSMAQETLSFIRSFIADGWSIQVAERMPILYGGSVKPNNASALMAEADIDGLLVGSASLDPDSFAQIVYHHSLVSGS